MNTRRRVYTRYQPTRPRQRTRWFWFGLAIGAAIGIKVAICLWGILH